MTELRLVYEGAGASWGAGPARLYDVLALRIVERCAALLRQRTVIDCGAGTGAVCRALQTVQASAVALDSSLDMLSRRDGAAPAVRADLVAMPFVAHSFDAAVGAFSVSHLRQPERGLAEMRRVVRPGGAVIATSFAAAPPNASKEVVDEVASQFGYVRPAWYTEFKTQVEARFNTAQLVAAAARSAGLDGVQVEEFIADAGIDTPEAVVDYRLGMAHLVPFVRSLDDATRRRMREQALREVAERGQPVRPTVLMLASRSAA